MIAKNTRLRAGVGGGASGLASLVGWTMIRKYWGYYESSGEWVAFWDVTLGFFRESRASAWVFVDLVTLALPHGTLSIGWHSASGVHLTQSRRSTMFSR
jgi:hypothetical protein